MKTTQIKNNAENSAKLIQNESENGFTLIEFAISMVILLVALLGVIMVFGFTVKYNAGNNTRSQTLAILQQEVELLRSLKFTSTAMNAGLSGGVKTPKFITMPNGNSFRVEIIIDDDPSVAGVQINNNKTLKEITISVSHTITTGNDWRQGFATSTTIRRVRGN